MKQNIFKSINLQSDVDFPERLSHYFPTAKTMSLIKAILFGEPASVNFVIAPYGSGKSLASGLSSIIINNTEKNRDHLKHFEQTFSDYDASITEFIQSRLTDRRSGHVVILYGFEANLIGKILSSFGLEADTSLSFVENLDLLKSQKFTSVDRVAIIWDEFGRHLENLVEQGQSHYLDELQMLAEWCSRQQKVLCTFNVLMHQALSTYSSRLTHTVNKEWKKVGGRFNTIRFVDRSRDVYLLMAKALSDYQVDISNINFEHQAKTAKEIGWFTDIVTDELAQALKQAYPLSAPVFYILPTLSARLGQNERSLFDFLKLISTEERSITMEDVYQYFSPDMQEDIGIGGFYKRWLECQSARSKCTDPLEHEILATVTLLQLGIAGERVALFESQLEQVMLMVHPDQHPKIQATIKSLLERKLLLSRSGNISIWHGIDIDLRNKLDEKISFMEKGFQLAHELQEHFPLEAIHSHEYNVRFNITRYMSLRYISAGTLFEEEAPITLAPSDDAIGRVILIQNENEQEAVINHLKSSDFPERIVHIVANTPSIITSLLLEMKALKELLGDTELLGQDPLIGKEIEGMYDRILKQLSFHLDELTELENGEHLVYFGSKRKTGSLSQNLSALFEKTYSKYFKVSNQIFVRKHISRSNSNVRRKLLSRLFEPSWWATPQLGYDESTSAIATAYRTVLQNTGIIQSNLTDANIFYDNEKDYELKYKELEGVWTFLKIFFTEPGEKSLQGFIDELQKPPYGIRAGIIPFLFAVGWKKFAESAILFKNDEFISDIFGSTIEDIFKNADQIRISIVHINTHIYLDALIDAFFEDGIKFERSSNRLMALYDYVMWWRNQLPESALKSNPKFGTETQAFQRLIRTFSDPITVFLEELPRVLDQQITLNEYNYLHQRYEYRYAGGNEIIKKVKALHQEIDGIIEGYTKEATEIIYNEICIPDESSSNWQERIQNWSQCFPSQSANYKRLNSEVRGFLGRIHGVHRYNNSSFARALSSLLLGKRFEEWDSRSAKEFAEKIRVCVKEIQREYLQNSEGNVNLKPYIVSTLNSTLSSLLTVSKGTREIEDVLRKNLSTEQISQLIEGLKANGS